jgi:phage terminase large subunit-like protein
VLQNIRNLSGATDKLQGLIADGKIHHNGDPVLSWMMSNVTGHYDRGGRVYPGKDRPEQKIDGAIALITALSRAMIGEVESGSVYDHPESPWVSLVEA